MRNLFLGCLVVSGLMSAAPAFAQVVQDDFVVSPFGIWTCENACVIVETNRWGEATKVVDSQGGWVKKHPQNLQRTDKVQ